MKVIKLTQGKETFVDDYTYEWAKEYKWYFGSRGYACRGYKQDNGQIGVIRLHHCIIGFPIDGLQTDHINGNRLDNRPENLHFVTPRKNIQNLECHRNGKLVGTSFHKDSPGKPWQARMTIYKKSVSLGYFATEQEAHERYLQEVKKRNLL